MSVPSLLFSAICILIPFVRKYPYVASHNRWVANKPGSTLLIPISDQVESTFNQLWIRIARAR